MENWSSFKKRIIIDKPVSMVYLCWATKSKMESWFLEIADFENDNGVKRRNAELAQKGDSFTWKWHNWDFTEKGEILATNNKDLISFTFGEGGNVQVSLKEIGKSTEVTLTQDKIPTDDKSKMKYYVGCLKGWTFWLTNLKAFLEHGITLHATGLNQSETEDLVNS